MSRMLSGGGADCLPTIIALYNHYVCRASNIELQVSVKDPECNITKDRLQAAGQIYANHGVIFSGDGSRVQAAALAIGLALFMALTTWIFSS